MLAVMMRGNMAMNSVSEELTLSMMVTINCCVRRTELRAMVGAICLARWFLITDT